MIRITIHLLLELKKMDLSMFLCLSLTKGNILEKLN